MAGTNRRKDNNLSRLMRQEPFRFDFFHAVRLAELLAPEREPVGYDGPPGREALTLRTTTSLRFPPSAIERIEDREEGLPPRMTTTFLGLYGRHGALPWLYTSRIVREERNGNRALREFLDIFNHRLLSLFYRAGIKDRFPLRYRSGGTDEMSRDLLAFMGLGTRGLRGRLPVPETALLRYAGLFPQPRSASTLSAILCDFCGVPVVVEQFRGEWLEIDTSDRNRIGRDGTGNRLGSSFTIGRRIWSRQHRFRVVVGPVGLAEFSALLPTEERFGHLTALTRLYAGAQFTFDVQLIMERASAPGMVLGRKESRLGRTMWVLSRRVEDGPIDCPVFRSESQPEAEQTVAA